MSNETNVKCETVTINDVKYVRADSVTPVLVPTGKRAVFILDRGWIMAGDYEEKEGRIFLTRAVNIDNYQGMYIDGMLNDWKNSKVFLRQIKQVFSFPVDAELGRFYVSDNWGIK